MKSCISILFALLCTANVFHAQIAHVKMQGVISVESENKSYNSQEFPIEIWCEGNLLSTHFPAENGAYELTLIFGKDYRIRFGSNPWVVKMVDVNLQTPVFPAGNIGYTLLNDISLFHYTPGSDFEFLNTLPVAVASFDYDANCMTWDTVYNERLTDSIIRTLKYDHQKLHAP